MNKLTSLLALLTIVVMTGCATTPETKIDEAQRIGRVLESLAFTGSVLVLDSNPDYREDFEVAAAALEALADEPEIGLSDVFVILRKLPINELKDPKAVLIVGNAQIILEEFGRGEIDLESLTYFRPVVRGLADGMNRGLVVINGGSGDGGSGDGRPGQ